MREDYDYEKNNNENKPQLDGEQRKPEQMRSNIDQELEDHTLADESGQSASKRDTEPVIMGEEQKSREQNELLVHAGKPKRKKTKERMKHMFTAISAGIIGSALTLTAAPFIDDVYHGEPLSNEAKTSQVQTTPVSTNGQTASDMIEEASKAIVGVVNMQRKEGFGVAGQVEKAGTGSGVIYRMKDGEAYIITNNHVIENADKLEISLQDGKTAKAELVGTDPLTDLAVVKTKADPDTMKTISLGDSDQIRAGDQVWAIGNPLGLELSRTVTEGIISAANRSIPVDTSAGKWNMDVIQTDAAISPGNSGGALISTSGKVIGINSMKIADNGSEGLGFAIPSNQVKTIVAKLMQDGKIQRPYLGIAVAAMDEIPDSYLEQANLTGSEKGVIVVTADPKSPAGKAGIKEGDIIQSIDGNEISSESSLRKQLYEEHEVGDKVKIDYTHNGKKRTVNIQLSDTGRKQ